MTEEQLNELAQYPLLTINTMNLMLLFFLALIAAYGCAWLNRHHYQTHKLIRSYGLYGIVHLFVGVFLLRMNVFLTLGTLILGAIVLIFRSNTHFYRL